MHFVYVGTVAETGDRQYPIQMGRCGDPLNPSVHDYYAMSKVFSEFSVFESGLKYWVSIRQTGQYPSAEGAGEEPIIFHQPANNVLEWSTSIESGICMANICEDWVPESFWRKAYNLSSGKGWRLTCWELTNISVKGMGLTFADINDLRQRCPGRHPALPCHRPQGVSAGHRRRHGSHDEEPHDRRHDPRCCRHAGAQ